jgi:RNA polymerase sigma-70 factor (ECF subfamily)
MTSDERDRARRFRKGEPEAFDAIYAEFGDRIYRFCFRLCGRAADAEDMAQETFLAAYRGRERFEGRSSLATWLYRIALFRWRKLCAAQRPQIAAPDDAPAPAADPARIGQARLALHEALAALPDDLRESFLLVKAEGLKYREAAEALGVPQGTVQFRVHAATQRLRALLSADAEMQNAPPERTVPVRREEAGDAL